MPLVNISSIKLISSTKNLGIQHLEKSKIASVGLSLALLDQTFRFLLHFVEHYAFLLVLLFINGTYPLVLRLFFILFFISFCSELSLVHSALNFANTFSLHSHPITKACARLRLQLAIETDIQRFGMLKKSSTFAIYIY